MKKTNFLLAALTLLLATFTTSAMAQHLIHRNALAEAEAMGMTVQRAQKAEAGWHRLLRNPHRNHAARTSGRTLQSSQSQTMMSPLNVVDNKTKMYGYMPYSKAWVEDQYGLYSFTLSTPIKFTKMPTGADGAVAADGGGCYYDGKYYAVTYAGFMGMILAEFCVYDTETWKQEEYIPVEGGSVSIDMDYDPTTGYIYGAFYNDSFDGLVFGRIDPNTGKRTAICDLNRIFFGISVNSKGEVYGLDEEGGLYQFDKTTGNRTLIGNTGILQQYLGCCSFDQKTDELYWCVSREDGSWMYLVDTETAQVTELCKFPNDEEIQGLYIPAPAAEANAPAAASNLSATFEGASLKGTFTFTMPMSTYGGSALLGSIEYEIYINDEPYSTGQAFTGSEVNATVEVPTYGLYKLSVRPKNKHGLAPAKFISTWIGKDVPAAVTDLNAADGTEPNQVVITWKAPTTSQHNGYLDVAGLTYRVERHHGEDVILLGVTGELTYTDKIENPGIISPYYYTVTPIVDGDREGESANSNSIGVGSALSLPYYNDFSDEHCLDIISIVDRHNDGKTWEWDPTFQAARAQYDWVNAKNEWLITPALQMKAGRVYKLGFDTWGRAGYVERFEVKMGQGKKYSDLKTTVVPRTEVRNDTPAHNFALIKVDSDGDYSFGFHVLSDVDQWWLYLDNISIEEGPLLGTPNAVTGLQLKAGEKGTLSTTISFTAPTADVENQTLADLSGIKVVLEGELIATLTPQPGEKVTYTDLTAQQGMNHYTIIPFNSNGDGLETIDSVYVGVDIPKAPRNVRLKKVNDKPVISWEAPTEGINGGYVNPDEVFYYIVRSDNAEVANRYKGLTITDDNLDLAGEQAFISYAVYAQNIAGISEEEYALSNEACFGTPFELPFHESFAGVETEMGPWTFDYIEGEPWLQIVDAGTYPNCKPQDEDGGLVSFEPENEGESAILYSSNISLVGAEKPQLSFWYYNNPGSFDKISARVRIDDDPDKDDELAYINMSNDSGKEGWTNVTCDLSKYIGHRIQLAFKFICNSDYYIHIDNISVSGLRKDLPLITDLAATLQGNTVSLTWSEPKDEQGLSFIGYNVYRDGQLLNTDEPLIDPMYDDQLDATDSKTHIYQVTVVYSEGETTYSNAVDQFGHGTGIQGILAGKDGLRYNLGGQRIATPKRGTYILGRKKYLGR